MRRNSKAPVFLLEAAFLREVVRELAPFPADGGFVERGIFISGPELRNLKVCCRMSARMDYAEQSSSRIRTTASSTLDALLGLMREGTRAYIFAHSHPGTGYSAATRPSCTDMRFMKEIQQNFRAQMIGLIVLTPSKGITFARFFSTVMDFRVRVEGSGVDLHQKEGNEYVYSLQTEPALCYRKPSEAA
jgi:hypothetical protein